MLKLSPILQRFAERSPFPVMIRALFERCLNPARLDAWFEANAEAQYTRELLFSSLFELMTRVVLRQKPSVHAAYQAMGEDVAASVTSVYNKLNGVEADTSAALVRYGAEQARTLIDELEGAHAPMLPGAQVRVLDGNCLAAREHRLKETRAQGAAPLPGKALAVFDPARELITALYPCEDAYTQERALLAPVLAAVNAGELWIADRNFCTAGFLRGLVNKEADALIRVHEQVRFRPLEPMREIGRVATGAVDEQWVELTGANAQGLRLRHIRLRLDKPTSDGDQTLYLFSSAAPALADACTLAQLYRSRWTLEKAFLHLTTELRCEIDTLAYPPAALFALACAVSAYNVLAVAKAALRAAHGHEAVDTLSGYHMAIELGNVAGSLDTVLDPQDWAVFHSPPSSELAAWLQGQAQRMNLRRYRKSRRGPKKPPPKRHNDPAKPHSSVARVLAERKKRAP